MKVVGKRTLEKATFLGTVRCIGHNKNEIDTTKILHQQCNITGKIKFQDEIICIVMPTYTEYLERLNSLPFLMPFSVLERRLLWLLLAKVSQLNGKRVCAGHVLHISCPKAAE